MVSKKENYLSMARNLAAVLVDYEDVWKTLPKFQAYTYEFFNLMGVTSKHKSSAEIKSTGATTDKEAAGNYAIDYASKLTKRATNYALDADNVELEDQLRIRRSELGHGHDSKISDKLNDVLTRMQAIENELKDHGVGPEELKKLQGAIIHYDSLLDKPRKLIRDRKGFNAEALQSLSKIRQLITRLDNAINYFEGSRFEMDYQNARIVIDLGTRKRKKKGDTDDAANGDKADGPPKDPDAIV